MADVTALKRRRPLTRDQVLNLLVGQESTEVPTIAALARMVGMERSTLGKALRGWESAGIIQIDRSSNGLKIKGNERAPQVGSEGIAVEDERDESVPVIAPERPPAPAWDGPREMPVIADAPPLQPEIPTATVAPKPSLGLCGRLVGAVTFGLCAAILAGLFVPISVRGYMDYLPFAFVIPLIGVPFSAAFGVGIEVVRLLVTAAIGAFAPFLARSVVLAITTAIVIAEVISGVSVLSGVAVMHRGDVDKQLSEIRRNDEVFAAAIVRDQKTADDCRSRLGSYRQGAEKVVESDSVKKHPNTGATHLATTTGKEAEIERECRRDDEAVAAGESQRSKNLDAGRKLEGDLGHFKLVAQVTGLSQAITEALMNGAIAIVLGPLALLLMFSAGRMLRRNR